ncbi:MAG: hypothetical protein HS101_04575 [Planctomycetia bacterium]|jgi:dienelactone hydrolase|nr:hypothetical protein [Planctomycetia bacterium]MCC7314229.1 hypothetical protein [Planctomycetota bacterium]
MSKKHAFCGMLVAMGLSLCAGCAVPQPRGEGLYQYVKEPTTGAGYHLYLPADYVKNSGRHPNPKMKGWPLVMTFHGMKPYDNALPQEREWEREADIYGYIICAPELHTSDSFMEYPLTREHDYVLEDKKDVLAIMDHIFATTRADPKKVLSTSWSCGGYLAHYFPNRFPERFSCIATRLSNFSSKLLIEETVPRYRDRTPVAIFIGDGDFPACKSESEEAVAWYTARGFRIVRGKMIDNMGHSRIPQTAAAFFAEHIGIEALHPKQAAATVAQVQMTEYFPPQEMIARMSPPLGMTFARSGNPVDSSSRRPTMATTPPTPLPTAPAVTSAVSYNNKTAGRQYPYGTSPSYDPSPKREEKPVDTRLASAADPKRGNWLEGPKVPPPSQASEPRRSVEQPKSASTSGNQSSPSPRNAESSRRRGSEPAGRAPTERSRPTASIPPPKSRTYSPSNAGPKKYEPSHTGGTPPSAAFAAARPVYKTTGPPPALRSKPTEPKREQTRPADRVRRVNVKLAGPAIGTSPHYLSYSIDLPREQTAGADFLWMDNGVWIGDEARGVKILESPGLHRISVLVVTADNMEYRGTATVQVLDRGPTAAAN